MKSKFSSIWRVAATLALVASMGMVFATPAAAEPDVMSFSPEPPVSNLIMDGPMLKIAIDAPSQVFACDNFNVTAVVCNTGEEDVADSVVISGTVAGEASPATLTKQAVGDICPGYCKEATWTLHCDAPGEATIEITATYMEDCTPVSVSQKVTVDQVCDFEVEITKPADGAEFDISDQFAVTAVVTNNTEDDCDSVNVSLAVTGNAEPVPLATLPIIVNVPIPAGESQEVNWTLHCTGQGPVGLTVTAEGCGSGCVDKCKDTITIQQPPVPCNCDPLTITFLDPPEADWDVCVCENFDVKAKVKNNGTCPLDNVHARLEVVTGVVNFVSLQEQNNYSLAPGEEQEVTWTLHCNGAPLDLGQNCTLHNYVQLKARAWAPCPSGIPGPTVYAPGPDQTYWVFTAPEFIDQQYLELEITPKTCKDYCVNDEFWVDFTLRNCHPHYWDGDVTIIVTGNAHVLVSKTYTIHLEGNDGLPGGLDEVTQINAWHLRCDSPGDVNISVNALGIVTLDNLTLCDNETEIVHQKTPADLDVTIATDPCVETCEEFNVTATITNPGGADAADATNVMAAMTATGDVTLVTPPTSLGPFTIAHDGSEILTWTFRCTGWDDASFHVDVTGTDAVCDVPLSATSATVYTEQKDLDVQIIAPEPCSEYHVSDTFCVTAVITDHDADTAFSSVNAVISFPIGGAELIQEETPSKDVHGLVDGDSQEVSWTVHCMSPGDADIKVEVKFEGDTCPAETVSDEITVHQIGATDFAIEIVSPDNLDTLVATSQDFTVTALIANYTELGTLTVTDLELLIHPENGASITEWPEEGFDIPEGDTQSVTWTLHCEQSGLLFIMAEATGESQVGQIKEAMSFPLLMWQYPTAHLEVATEAPTEVNVGDPVTVSARIYNTGEADATEVSATLSMTPQGSASLAGGETGFTKPVGTIPGHDADVNLQGRHLEPHLQCSRRDHLYRNCCWL